MRDHDDLEERETEHGREGTIAWSAGQFGFQRLDAGLWATGPLPTYLIRLLAITSLWIWLVPS